MSEERPRWFFDERRNPDPAHIDPERVAAYDRRARFDPTDEVELLRSWGLEAHHSLLDAGSGNGTFALAVAPYCREVVALDISPTMLEQLETRAREHSIAGIRTVEAGLLEYVPAGDPFDVIYCRNTLHHLPDFWKVEALRRFASWLVPGGTLRLRDLVYSFDVAVGREAIEHWIDRTAREDGSGFSRAELEAHVREEYSTYCWLLEPMIERSGFEIVAREYHPSWVYAAYIARRR